MKLIKDETAGSGKSRYVLHIGPDEIELLVGVLHNALRYTPRTLETSSTHSRMHQMRKVFINTLNPPNDKRSHGANDTKL